MRYHRPHRKVLLAWCSWAAVQVVLMWELSFGVRVEHARPLVVFFFGPVTVALGRHPVIQWSKHYSALGMIHADGSEQMTEQLGRDLLPHERQLADTARRDSLADFRAL